MKRIKVDNTDIFLEDLGGNKGKITISDTYNHNYSYFWGAMGGTLEQFILSINSSYFSDKLLGSKSNYVFDAKRTFAAIRKFIAQDLELPWYKHLEFQKDLRDKINDYQRHSESADGFVSCWSSFINSIDFYTIKDRYERERVEKEFKGISEQWNFIGERLSSEYLWLEKLHKKLKKALLSKEQDAKVSDATLLNQGKKSRLQKNKKSGQKQNSKPNKHIIMEWISKAHSYQIADTGDYDGCYEVTNGKISLLTKDDGDDIEDRLKDVCNVLNSTEINFYFDDSDKHIVEVLTKENSSLHKLLEENGINPFSEAPSKGEALSEFIKRFEEHTKDRSGGLLATNLLMDFLNKNISQSLPVELGQWISVEKRLPEDGESVITVHVDAGGVDLADYNTDTKKWEQFGSIHELLVTHWMPLPQPPIKN